MTRKRMHRVSLPGPPEGSGEASRAMAMPRGAPTILVVEDEGIVAKDLQVRLHHLGYQVPEIAGSGEEALRKARTVRPQLVLMDINLPGSIDGLEAAQRIRDELKIPVIFLSAYNDETTQERMRLLDGAGYLGKPVEDQQLHAVLNAFFSRSKLSGGS
jgi:CheY-like chemotaxis protein